jgi:hypothetical protein
MPHFVAFLYHSQLNTHPVCERVVSSAQRPLPTKLTLLGEFQTLDSTNQRLQTYTLDCTGTGIGSVEVNEM